VITLLTDFGTADYFVGAVKGAILSVNPKAVIADITHEIPPQDIEAGAFTLLACYNTFPAGTIHVAVVDPGVGSERRPIVVSANEQFFVGPDNGIFSYICDREASHRTFHITAEKYFRPSPSNSLLPYHAPVPPNLFPRPGLIRLCRVSTNVPNCCTWVPHLFDPRSC